MKGMKISSCLYLSGSLIIVLDSRAGSILGRSSSCPVSSGSLGTSLRTYLLPARKAGDQQQGSVVTTPERDTRL